MMAKLADPTIPFAGVVARRRRERAAADGQTFRLGTVGHDWASIYREPGSKVVIGASDAALGRDDLEHTVKIIGAAGGVLADLGFQVCPVSALTDGRLGPSLIVWVGGPDTTAHERDQLAALCVPGVWIGSCIEAPHGWRRIDSSEFDDRNQFIRRFAAAVTELVPR